MSSRGSDPKVPARLRYSEQVRAEVRGSVCGPCGVCVYIWVRAACIRYGSHGGGDGETAWWRRACMDCRERCAVTTILYGRHGVPWRSCVCAFVVDVLDCVCLIIERVPTRWPHPSKERATRGVKQRYKPKAKPRPRPAGIEYSVPRREGGVVSLCTCVFAL